MAHTAISDPGRSESYLEMSRSDLNDPASYSAPTLTCDLIMKGGITSGVVYPQAACRLATRYRLKQVGGASAGAIAAALAGAAEYHRQHSKGSDADHQVNAERAGFVRLAAIPTDLGANLGELFQPVQATRQAHSVLMAAVAPGRSKAFKAVAAVGRLVVAAPIAFLLTLAVTLVPLVVWALTNPGELSGDQQVLMCCPRHVDEVRIRYLPDAPSMPVAIAARISLSFPGLISALPLLCVDYSRGPGHRKLITAWFSDGGIASNFPMHFFDAPWPSRPTFGLNLDKEHPDYPGQMVWRPQKTLSGVFPRSHEPTTMVGFASAVVRTMQNWVDASQITMPGFRDRVAELRTGVGEGGLNLRMKQELIDKLAMRGSCAALEFADFDFSLHEWVRYRAMMNSLSESLDMMGTRWPESENDEGYERLIARYAGTPGDYQLDPADACADAQATEQLMSVVGQWEQAGYPATAPTVPEPKPRLRQMPPL